MVAGGLAHHHVAAEEPKAVKRASAFKIGKHGRTSRTEPNVGSLRPDQQGFMHHFSSEASEVTNLLDDSKMEELRKAEAKARRGRALPLHFFSGPTGSSVFDLGVAVATVVIVLEGHGAMIVVQMLRILRLMKFLNNYSARAGDRAGHVLGPRATGAIMALLFMIMYVYAILGVRAFRHNDPVHFGTVQQAMLTLFVISTR
ncbi:low voltage-gated calcium channel [Aureococcus anophagefferens]|uniref:Low voltage-gated calcium channel n=1 Tax=Aureococcus anophagefferens TaxID=44056 RepID=A0ABR1FMR2_AURAN